MPEKTNADFREKYEVIASRRNPKDLSFFYGVRTTGVFCRPLCSSRVPKLENVLLFDSAKEAMREGFRPCRRCRPLQDEGAERAELIVSICRIIENAEEGVTLGMLADKRNRSCASITPSWPS